MYKDRTLNDGPSAATLVGISNITSVLTNKTYITSHRTVPVTSHDDNAAGRHDHLHGDAHWRGATEDRRVRLPDSPRGLRPGEAVVRGAECGRREAADHARAARTSRHVRRRQGDSRPHGG